MSSDPNDCFGTSLWGLGPWSFEGTDEDLKAWAYTHAFIPLGIITVSETPPHPDHDAGLMPDPHKYHPNPTGSITNIDPTQPLSVTEWNLLYAEGYLESPITEGPKLISPSDLSLAWSQAQLGPSYPIPVGVCPPHPAGSGYGGESYGHVVGGDSGYGLSAYGSVWHMAPEMLVSGGYGGDPYGLGGYGSTEVVPPKLSSAISLTGWEIEIFFNEEMDPSDPELLNPANYSLLPVGTTAAPSNVYSVRVEKLGTIDITAGDYIAGVTSVVVTHSGTTLGGTYQVRAENIKDIAGNVILGAEVGLLTKGEPPAYSVIPVGDNQLRLRFAEKMLLEGDYHAGAVETIKTPASYGFTSSPDYPIKLQVTEVEHPYGGNENDVLLTTLGQTSIVYTSEISPSTVQAYDGSVLPDTIAGVSYASDPGVVSTNTIVSSRWVVGQSNNGATVWDWADTTGFVGLNSTFRTDLTFDANNSFTKPVGAVANRILEFQLGDGAVELNVAFGWDGGAGLPLLTIDTGPLGFTQTTSAYDWTVGENTVSLVRNQKAGIVTCLWNDSPIFSTAIANLAAPAVPWGPGNRISFTTSPAVPTISGFRIVALNTTSSSTVFSAAWNFLHGHTALPFMGSIAHTKDSVQVARGPLVKGWGDATPATKQDVSVVVNNIPVEVKEVNPYIGKITTVIPIPLMPMGMSDVKVDYQWMATPVMEFAGLNTEGLVLNKYDCTHGHHDPAEHGEQIQTPDNPKGAPDISRYPMGVVLGPMHRPEPLFIGHRYMGFERDYSALLNSPTTMLLNQHPNKSIQDPFVQRPEGESVSFNGEVRPTSSTPAWELLGTDTGGIELGPKGATGVYQLTDINTGSYDPDNPQAAYYWRDADLTFPSTVYQVSRFRIDRASVITDGVFTGVGMGIHDGAHLYMMGCLLVNGVEHVAMLTDANKPSRYESWQLGPQAQLSLFSQTEATALATQVPADLKAGDRFQVFHGDGDMEATHTQSGVYTLSNVVFQTDGTVTLTIDGEFPEPWDVYGNKYPIAVFEVLWSSPEISTTFRLTVDPDQQVAVLEASGDTTATVTTLDGSVAQLPQPAETSLLLPAPLSIQNGQVFWGSLSREAASSSYWTFSRYGVVPDVTSIAGHEVIVESEMTTVPEQDPNNDWMLLGNFGYSEVDVSNNALLLKQTSAHPARSLLFGYARNETWFTADANFDLTANFRVESGSGVQDAQILIQDTHREVRLATLLYGENTPVLDPKPTVDVVDNHRYLVRCPDVSFNGLQLPSSQTGWTQPSYPHEAVLDVQESCLVVTQAAEHKFSAVGELQANGLSYAEENGRVLEARFAVTSYMTSVDGFTGIQMQGAFADGRVVGLHLYEGGVRLFTASNVAVEDYPFAWNDGELHTYRIVMDSVGGIVSVYLDDAVQLPTKATADFAVGGSSNHCSFGQVGKDGSGANSLTQVSTVEWKSCSLQGLAPSNSKRTLGVYLGGDVDSINSWELPRTDSTPYPNSSQLGTVIEEMDWRSDMEVRLWRDPTWGITVLRPDLPLPPFYQGEVPNVAGTGFATELTEPSAGWINVEYADLPRSPTTFGRVSWGSLRSDNINQQRWDRVRYRMFGAPDEDISSPDSMVLNQFNVITSGELTEDKGYETVVVQTLDDTRVTLLPTHLYADRIWKVIDGDNVYTSEMFRFRNESQLISLLPDDEGVPRCFGVKVQGSQGAFGQNTKVLTDTTADFSGVVVDDLLKIHFGASQGTYRITEVSQHSVTVANPFPADAANGVDVWSISAKSTPVTIVLTPGKPVTNTYLLNQPLLDGITKLNEGTPPVPMSQTGESFRDDTVVVDPKDPFTFASFKDPEGTHYESLEFYQVDNGGDEGLISFPCEATELSEQPGFLDTSAGQGDPIYEKGGAGDALNGVGDSAGLTETGAYTGYPSGGHLMYFQGSSFWEGMGALTSTIDSHVVHTVDQGGGMFGKLFFASGGNYHGPVLPSGKPEALGGTLGPNTAILYPTYPSLPPREGGGKIYRRTEWHMEFRELITHFEEVSGDPIGAMLDEDLSSSISDNTPTSGPHIWTTNPNGTPAGNGLGAVFISLGGVGDYSRLGPFGGLNSLSATKDYGRFDFLENPLTVGTTVTVTGPAGASVTFTAAAVPASNTEFQAAPAPGVSLAAAINSHPTTSGWVEAYWGTNLSGQEAVRVEALLPVTVGNEIGLLTSDPARIRTLYLDLNGLLGSGSKMTQSSVLAGGDVTLVSAVHEPLAGMVAMGGSSLPKGVPQHLTLVSV